MYLKNLNIRYFVLLLVEAVLIFATILLIAFYRPGFSLESYSNPYFFKTLILVVIYLISFHYFDLYHPSALRLSVRMIANLILSLITASIILFALYYFAPSIRIGRGTLLPNLIVLPIVLMAWRTIYLKWLSGDLPKERVLVLGSGNFARKIVSDIISMNELGFKVMGFIDDDPKKFGTSIVNPKVLGGYVDLMKAVKALRIHRIIVALPDRRKKMPMAALMNSKLLGVRIEEGETFHERITGKVPLDQLRPSWFVFSDGFKSLRSRKILKRLSDILLSIIGILLASPIFLITAIAIRLESPGPIILKQKRIGEKGDVYTLYKFRSMRNDAETKSGPVWAGTRDARITKVGKIIRKSRIDELPQMINVLKGDMSFVGPRPERPYFVSKLRKEIPYYGVRSIVKPGITGWAQIKYPYGASAKDAMEKLQYDLYYIKNMSIIFDMLIVLKTIRTVLSGGGAR